jgi:hypothetical protein
VRLDGGVTHRGAEAQGTVVWPEAEQEFAQGRQLGA